MKLAWRSASAGLQASPDSNISNNRQIETVLQQWEIWFGYFEYKNKHALKIIAGLEKIKIDPELMADDFVLEALKGAAVGLVAIMKWGTYFKAHDIARAEKQLHRFVEAYHTGIVNTEDYSNSLVEGVRIKPPNYSVLHLYLVEPLLPR